MPVTKLSWPGLKEHIRKYFWIYAIGIVVCLFGTDLLWTMTAPRIPEERQVVVYMVDTYSNAAPLEDVARDMLSRTRAEDNTLENVEFQPLQFSDPATDYSGTMVLMTRLTANECDILLLSPTAMAYMEKGDVLLELDDYLAQGWMADSGLEPYYAEVEVEDASGEVSGTRRYVAGLRLDDLDRLGTMGAFNNEGAFLAFASNSTNLETSMRAAEIMVEDLRGEAENAAAEG